MKEEFKKLIPELDLLIDKEAALKSIKCREWPLSKKPKWYNKDHEKTMQINHYIKSYLYLILK